MEFLIFLNRIYHKYKIRIWFVIGIIALFLLIMYALSNLQENGNSSNSNITTISENTQNNEVYSVVNNVIAESSNDTVEQDISTIQTSISSNVQAIESFIMLCNNGKVDLAYSMISDDCKEALYPTKSDFENSYYNALFKTQKIADIENYEENIYKVSLSVDPIETGDNSQGSITDYITVDSNYKINVSGFIKKEDMDVTKDTEYLKVNITQKIVYVDYEVYTVSFENYTTVKMSVDVSDNINVYLKDSSGNVFNIVNYEYADADFYFYANTETELSLKFSRKYDTENNTSSINFNDIKLENVLYDENNEVISTASYPYYIDVVVNL